MKKSMILLAISAVMIFASCGNEGSKTDKKSPDNNIVQADDESINNENETNITDEENLTDEESVPTENENELSENDEPFNNTTPVAENALMFEFKGILNSIETNPPERGLATFTVLLNGEKVVLDVDASGRVVEKDDKKLIQMSAFTDLETLDNTPEMQFVIKYNVATAIVDSADLMKIKNEGTNIITSDKIQNASMYAAKMYKKKDETTLVRFCQIAVNDKKNSDSAIFVNHKDNKSFDVGENIFTKGNVALTDDKAAILELFPDNVEDEGLLCSYRINADWVSKEEFYAEVEKGIIDCKLPENYLTPASENYFTFQFNGIINKIDAAQNSQTTASSDYKLHVNGKDIKITDMGGYSQQLKINETDVTGIFSFGDYLQHSDGTITYNMLEIHLPTTGLNELKTSGKNTFAPGDNGYPLLLSVIWNKKDENKYIGKLCPIGVVPANDTTSSFFVCHDKNVNFAEGEKLQIAANINLSTDAEAIKSFYKIEDVCYCVDGDGATVDCSEF